MADRVKYFLLGLLFLVVAGVIAFDRWNSREADGPGTESARTQDGEAEIWFDPPQREEDDDLGGTSDDRGAGTLQINPPDVTPPVKRKEVELIPPPIVPEPKPAPRPKPEPASDAIHVVQPGETLGEIAQHYYPGRVQSGIRLIVEANQIANPNRIRENDKLVIPASNVRRPGARPSVDGTNREPAPVRRETVKRETVNRETGIPGTYTVKQGDGDLYAICRRFYGRAGEGARIVRIMEMNDLVSTRVRTGTTLKLPPK